MINLLKVIQNIWYSNSSFKPKETFSLTVRKLPISRVDIFVEKDIFSLSSEERVSFFSSLFMMQEKLLSFCLAQKLKALTPKTAFRNITRML